MIERLLQVRLDPIARDHSKSRLWRAWMLCWAAAALAALTLLLIRSLTGWSSSWMLLLLAFAAVAATWTLWSRNRRHGPDYRAIARKIEEENPKLHALLLTAIEQHPDRHTGKLNYLQERVVTEALQQDRTRWRSQILQRLFLMRLGGTAALLALTVTLASLYERSAPLTSPFAFAGRTLTHAVEVSPGDASVEKGSSLVVLARFEKDIPSEATLVVRPRNEPERRIPLARNLADPVFGTSIRAIEENLTYRIEFNEESTEEFNVTVFEFPRLERADIRVVFPGYTGLNERTINDTRRVSAVEGSRLNYTFHLNKPVQSATLKPREGPPVELAPDPDRPGVYLAAFTLSESARYDLLLVDDEGRANKFPPQFVMDALQNRPPELRFTFPRGDQRVSALEEIVFEGEVRDDFGVKAFGIAYNLAGQETDVIQLGGGTRPHEKAQFTHLLPLEDLNAQPDQLLSYYLWAEDTGPDGNARRVMTDMFFAEIRPFEEIFREGQSMAGGDQQDQQGRQGQGGGGEADRLADLQKQIISATWNLQRRETGATPSAPYQEDAALVRDSQIDALEQVRSQRSRTEDPQSQALLQQVEQEMEHAVEHLARAADQNQIKPLSPALAAEQSAYQALLRLSSREFQVARGGQRQGGQQAGSSRAQRQLNQLDLRQSENRYETQSRAVTQMDQEQREQLQTFNRLRELAQRQQDVNERLRELEAALREADSQAEREEIQRNLQRLREEQQDLLADVDELRQRMDRPENQSRMAEARQQLDETRSDVQRAAEAMEQGSVSDAIASGTRAQRDLQQLREEFRRESSSQFADAMREMRDHAQELSRQQDEIARDIEALTAPGRRQSLTDSDERRKIASRLEEQRERLEHLIEQATDVTEQAELVEPLLARQLYETLRREAQEDSRHLREMIDDLLAQGRLYRGVYDRLRTGREQSRRAVDVTADLLRDGFTGEAGELEERARRTMTDLRRGIEQAAESVLGDETEALRLARGELDQLRDQLEREIAQGERRNAQQGETRQARGGQDPDQEQQEGASAESAQARAGETRDSASREEQPGQPGQRGREGASPGQEIADAQGQGGQQGGNRQTDSAPQDRESQGTPGERSERAEGQAGLGGDRDRESGTFFDQLGGSGGGGEWLSGPITGGQYRQWVDRLRDVEDLLDSPELRAEAARIRDRARLLRSDFQRHAELPQWDLVRLELARPLAELHTRVSEELARRQSSDALVPIDRDPVPSRYSELVRRYYERLGTDAEPAESER